ncbi:MULTISPECIES: hypothetical protein [Acidobacteriaceae]|uniref:hypothetical protein n=1 Tax=Acidobacteriaceae TaxID=204434 RepID=UPI00131C9BD2|nr:MULTISPECIES: hypothetical protein [Acidobacteriaceae]MDW5267914.1 hypothetical protein [Edaphobacter sp.]
MKACLTLCLLLGTLAIATAQTPATAPQTAASSTRHIAPNSSLFIEPMDGFETYLSAAILKKKVPVIIVDDKSKADYIVNGTSHVQKAGWAKTIFVSPASSAGASITIKDAKTGNLVFAYSVDKLNAARAAQSTAEACAKHLKHAIEDK